MQLTTISKAFAFCSALALVGCDDVEFYFPENPNFEYTYDFTKEGQQWQSGFADYPIGEEQFYELEAKPLVEYELKAGGARTGYKLSGNNHSDDLFMYIKTPVEHLSPNHMYQVKISVTVASNVGHGCFGIGGSPGDAVWIKSGVTIEEPVGVESDGYYRLNIDAGSQSQDGSDAVVLDNYVAEGLSCVEDKYALKTVTNEDKPMEVITDNTGKVWLFLGLDSGFEGITTAYIDSYSIELKRL